MGVSTSDKQDTFKTFPEFSKLALADKQKYDALIAPYPPIGDISFVSLMNWWNPLDNMSIAELNDNLVIPYWLPGDETHSGLSLVGTNKVDESLCAIFDYLKEQGRTPRLVNVPEIVVSNVQYPDMFTFKEERRYNEYILPVERFFPLKNLSAYRRRKVERLLSRVGEKRIVTRSIDLQAAENRKLLFDAAMKWEKKSINNYGKLEADALKSTIEHSALLNIENACLFVNDKLYGFCLYDVPHDRRYVDIKHIKATHDSTLRFELIGYMFAKWFAERGTLYANLGADYGLLRLRMFMLTLGPANFFRKYTIQPIRKS